MAEQFPEAKGPTASAADLAQAHGKWLSGLAVPAKYTDEWKTHEAFAGQALRNGWKHYNAQPANMIWRFSSKPASEFISITKDTTIDTIIFVIGKHSGGAEKGNVDVKTSSWCRNIGALIGTAASVGGDKKVLQIANCAEYLLGIDLRTLAAHGISAHPALYRLISMFETEYVLVPTPGNQPVSLNTLATVKVLNPFKGRIQPSGAIIDSKVKLEIRDPQRGFVKPWDPIRYDEIIPTDKADPAWVEVALQFAAKCSVAATELSGAVKDKEAADDPTIRMNAMHKYAGAH